MLAEPMEYLDLDHGDSFELRVEAFDDDVAVIHPRFPTSKHIRQHMDERGLDTVPPAGTPISVTTPVLRLYGERLDEFSPARYFDISSKTLRADLLARLKAGLRPPFRLSLQAHGQAPLKRYSVQIG